MTDPGVDTEILIIVNQNRASYKASAEFFIIALKLLPFAELKCGSVMCGYS